MNEIDVSRSCAERRAAAAANEIDFLLDEVARLSNIAKRSVRSNDVTAGPGDIGHGPYCPQFDADGPDEENQSLADLLRDMNRQLALAGTALAAKDERACRLQLGLMLDNLRRVEFSEWSP